MENWVNPKESIFLTPGRKVKNHIGRALQCDHRYFKVHHSWGNHFTGASPSEKRRCSLVCHPLPGDSAMERSTAKPPLQPLPPAAPAPRCCWTSSWSYGSRQGMSISWGPASSHSMVWQECVSPVSCAGPTPPPTRIRSNFSC